MKDVVKYFIAIVPPSPIFEKAHQWKLFFQEKHNSKAALRSPPHITLHMPFEWKSSKENYLIERVQQFASTCSAFDIMLKGFSSFPPRVIFINVDENDALKSLQNHLVQFCKRELNVFNANRLDLPYHPHLTVAFRDLKKNVFHQAWASVEHEKFEQTFTCHQLSLLKHNGKSWDIFHQFDFNS